MSFLAFFWPLLKGNGGTGWPHLHILKCHISPLLTCWKLLGNLSSSLPLMKSTNIPHKSSSGATGRETVPVQERGDEVVPSEPWRWRHHHVLDGVVSWMDQAVTRHANATHCISSSCTIASSHFWYTTKPQVSIWSVLDNDTTLESLQRQLCVSCYGYVPFSRWLNCMKPSGAFETHCSNWSYNKAAFLFQHTF